MTLLAFFHLPDILWIHNGCCCHEHNILHSKWNRYPTTAILLSDRAKSISKVTRKLLLPCYDWKWAIAMIPFSKKVWKNPLFIFSVAWVEQGELKDDTTENGTIYRVSQGHDLQLAATKFISILEMRKLRHVRDLPRTDEQWIHYLCSACTVEYHSTLYPWLLSLTASFLSQYPQVRTPTIKDDLNIEAFSWAEQMW